MFISWYCFRKCYFYPNDGGWIAKMESHLFFKDIAKSRKFLGCIKDWNSWNAMDVRMCSLANLLELAWGRQCRDLSIECSFMSRWKYVKCLVYYNVPHVKVYAEIGVRWEWIRRPTFVANGSLLAFQFPGNLTVATMCECVIDVANNYFVSV